jgi:hypothetical protein
MKIKALKPICGPKIHIMAGHEAEIDDETGKLLVAESAAVELESPKAAEAEGAESEPEAKKKGGKKKAAEAEGADKK